MKTHIQLIHNHCLSLEERFYDISNDTEESLSSR